MLLYPLVLMFEIYVISLYGNILLLTHMLTASVNGEKVHVLSGSIKNSNKSIKSIYMK